MQRLIFAILLPALALPAYAQQGEVRDRQGKLVGTTEPGMTPFSNGRQGVTVRDATGRITGYETPSIQGGSAVLDRTGRQVGATDRKNYGYEDELLGDDQ